MKGRCQRGHRASRLRLPGGEATTRRGNRGSEPAVAHLEDLIEEVSDPNLRDRIAEEVRALKKRTDFGLVFEGHEPETVQVRAPVRVGSRVAHRRNLGNGAHYTVQRIEDTVAHVIPDGVEDADREGESVAYELDELLVVKRAGEPVYPGLRSLGALRRDPGSPSHVVINGENLHALHLLLVTHARRIDVIYIDPPYNTGDRSWKYNNRFVDSNDGYRHSKWLSFMETRLKLVPALLKPDGVLIITIDQHEFRHLGVLLSDLFPEAYLQMATIVTAKKGARSRGLAREDWPVSTNTHTFASSARQSSHLRATTI